MESHKYLLSYLTTLFPLLYNKMDAVTPPSELAVTLSSLNSACSTRISYSPPCKRRPRKYLDLKRKQSTI